MRGNTAWLVGLVALVALGALCGIQALSTPPPLARQFDLRWVVDTSWNYTYTFELTRTATGGSYTARAVFHDGREPFVTQGTLDQAATDFLLRSVRELPPVRRAELSGPGGTFTASWLGEFGYVTRVGDVATNPAYQAFMQSTVIGRCSPRRL